MTYCRSLDFRAPAITPQSSEFVEGFSRAAQAGDAKRPHQRGDSEKRTCANERTRQASVWYKALGLALFAMGDSGLSTGRFVRKLRCLLLAVVR